MITGALKKTVVTLHNADIHRMLCRARVAVVNLRLAKSEIERFGGELVRQYRMRHGLNQRQFAERFGITSVWVCKIERGHAPLTLEMAAKMFEKWNPNQDGKGAIQ
jgi:DNA-binding XRE family transcriptional regulator